MTEEPTERNWQAAEEMEKEYKPAALKVSHI